MTNKKIKFHISRKYNSKKMQSKVSDHGIEDFIDFLKSEFVSLAAVLKSANNKTIMVTIETCS